MGRGAAGGGALGGRGYEWVEGKDFIPHLCPHSRPEGLEDLTAGVGHKAPACCPSRSPHPLPQAGLSLPTRNEDGDFFFSLEPVFPQISGDAGSCCFHGNLPANLTEVELGSRPRPSACAAWL